MKPPPKSSVEERRARMPVALEGAWALLPLFEGCRPEDPHPREALETAQAWLRGEATVGDVRKAAQATHAAAREAEVLSARFAARAIGHAAATAHVARHADGVAYYGAKAKAALELGN